MIYCFSEYVKTVYSYILTKIIMRQASLIRHPIYIRGGYLSSTEGGIRLTTGRFCKLELCGHSQTLHIGKDCKFGDLTHIVAMNDVRIGNDVLIASKCYISDSNHGLYSGDNCSSPEEPPNNRALIKDKVRIGDNVWIGENVVILAGADIGEGCVIGANSVVSRKIPKYSMVIERNKIIKTFNEGTNRWESNTINNDENKL